MQYLKLPSIMINAALKSVSGTYYFKGSNNGSMFDVAGSSFVYQIHQHGCGYREELTSRGPLQEKLTIEVSKSLCISSIQGDLMMDDSIQ